MIKTTIDTRLVSRIYPGICVGILSSIENNEMEKEGKHINIKLTQHLIVLPFIEFGIGIMTIEAEDESALTEALKDIENAE